MIWGKDGSYCWKAMIDGLFDCLQALNDSSQRICWWFSDQDSELWQNKRSINQPGNKWANQSINQSTWQQVSKSINQSINHMKPFDQFAKHWLCLINQLSAHSGTSKFSQLIKYVNIGFCHIFNLIFDNSDSSWQCQNFTIVALIKYFGLSLIYFNISTSILTFKTFWY